MTSHPPASVVLPTVEWTPACREVADQLGPEDELLVVCDGATDPVARRDEDLPKRTRLVFAGDPESCSGKTNAIAAGMEAARNDRIVWTDDDFHHPPNWLERLQEGYEVHGPATELPFFVGRDPLAVLLEPTYALGGTAGVYAGDNAWAGAVIFERDDLDEDALLRDLRRTVSDDGLLGERLDVTPLRRARRVAVGGAIRETLERHVRFVQIVRRHDPVGMAVMVAAATLATIVCLLVPLVAFPLLTLLYAGIYLAFGVRRWTALLAYPATLCQVPLFAYALARRTFVWGGRRYRWRSKFDVEILD